jgi:hypothetical protein
MFYFFKLNRILPNCKKIFIVLFIVTLLLFFITKISLNNVELNVEDGITQRSNYEWVLNDNLIQYSIYIIIKPQNLFSIESFLFTNIGNEFKDLRCFLSIPDQNIVQIVPLKRVIKINPPLLKVFCEFSEPEVRSETKVYAAVIESYKIKETIVLQRAVIIDSQLPKIKSIGHCVHTLRGLGNKNSNKTKNLNHWLDTQKKIGISEVKFYILNE